MSTTHPNRSGCADCRDDATVTLGADDRNALLRELDDLVYCATDANLLRLDDEGLRRLRDAVDVTLALRRPIPQDDVASLPVPRRALGRVIDRLTGWGRDGVRIYRDVLRSSPADFTEPGGEPAFTADQ